jgi:hypothetical protein
MNSQFIPLVPRNAGQPAESPTPAQPFQALHAPGGSAHPLPHAAVSPQITLKRNGDQITHISVVCSCGQVVELACVY